MYKINKFFLIILIFFFVLHSRTVLALGNIPQVILESSKNTTCEFYVDVFLDPNGSLVNGVAGMVAFPKEKMSFIRAEDGQSFIRAWIEKPYERNGLVSFSGIIPNGFSGVIEKINDQNKKAGLLFRLFFQAKKSGLAEFKTEDFMITLNDGLGTTRNLHSISKKIELKAENNSCKNEILDTQKPELSAEVVFDPNLFENKRVLIFQAIDRESGIQNIAVEENNGGWKEVVSPYLLEDQSTKGIIKVRATDYAGNFTIFVLRSVVPVWIYFLVIIIFIFLCIFSFIYKYPKFLYAKKSKK